MVVLYLAIVLNVLKHLCDFIASILMNHSRNIACLKEVITRLKYEYALLKANTTHATDECALLKTEVKQINQRIDKIKDQIKQEAAKNIEHRNSNRAMLEDFRRSIMEERPRVAACTVEQYRGLKKELRKYERYIEKLVADFKTREAKVYMVLEKMHKGRPVQPESKLSGSKMPSIVIESEECLQQCAASSNATLRLANKRILRPGVTQTFDYDSNSACASILTQPSTKKKRIA